MRVFLLCAGALLLFSSLRLRAKARTAPSALYVASLACGGLGLMVWAPENSLAVDKLLYTPGVGHLLTIWLISLCFILQFAFITLLTARCPRLHLWAYTIHATLLALFTLAWIAVHISLDGSFGTMAYGAYAGGPWPVVVMDCTGSLSIVVPGLLGAWGYLRFLLEGHRLDECLGAAGALSVLTGAAVYGVLILVNTITNSLGAHGIGLFALRIPIILISATLAPLTMWLVIHLQPLWRHLSSAWGHGGGENLLQREEELFQLRLDLLDAQAVLDDAVARLQHFADGPVVEDVASRSARCDLFPYGQRAAIEAAIWATAMRDRPSWTPWTAASAGLLPDEIGDPEQLSKLAYQAHRFTADTLRVVLLVLGRRHLPEGIQARPEPPGWRRRAAAIVLMALRDHGYTRAMLLRPHSEQAR